MDLTAGFKDSALRFRVFMYLVSAHSFLVGLGLIFLPPEVLARFGYQLITERFFVIQGGVFHVVMSIGYLMASRDDKKYEGIVYLSVIAKCLAAVFLFTFSIISKWIPVVFVSGIGDLIMGVLILVLFLQSGREG